MSSEKSIKRQVKCVILLGDGMADHPVPALGGKTPLQAALTPNMDKIASIGRSGLAVTVPEGYPPGSDVANLSVMGYDPRKYYTGRAPLEAAAMGISLQNGEIAFRCNLVTVEDGIMKDYSAGHITSDEGAKLVKSLKHLAPEERLYPGVSYRNLLVMQAGEETVCTPPHDISDQPIADHLPKGKDAGILIGMMEASCPVLERHPVNLARIAAGKRPATMIWLWGQGRAPRMPSLRDEYGISGAVISAVDLLKGIGAYAGMEVIDVPGATGTIDTNYEGKVASAFDALERVDVVYLHIEAADEAAHEGDLTEKVRAIELFDERVVGPVLKGLGGSGFAWKLLILPDHPTPIEIRTHTREPVPFAMAGEGVSPDGVMTFDEEAAKAGGYGTVEGWDLMGMLVGKR